MAKMQALLPDEIYLSALNGLGEGVIILDPNGDVTWMNAQAEQLLGWTSRELHGRRLHDMVHYQKACGAAYPEAECDTHITLNTGEPRRNSDDVFTRRDGTLIPVSHVTTPLLRDGRVNGVALAFHDITERKRAEQMLILQAAALESAANAIFITDRSGTIKWVNRAFERMSGYSADEVLGQNPRVLCSHYHDDEFYQQLWRTVLAGEVWRGEVVERRRDGSLYTVVQTVTPITMDGATEHFIAIHEDISARKQAEEKIRYMAMYDALTGLPNRRLLQSQLEQALAAANRNERLLGVLFLDLNDFKDVNDNLGHEAGDALLKQAADRLRECVRRSDTVARFGGDEFVVLQTALDHVDGSAALAEKIIAVLTRPYAINGRDVHTGVSIGIAIYPFEDGDAERLLRHADMAMYRAKADSGSSYQFFDIGMHREMRRRVEMQAALRQALAEEQFTLVYQPQFRARDGALIGMEALVRWSHPRQGMISPEEFIPVAEASGQIHALGEWVLRTACRQARQWQAQGLPALRLGVNLSACQLRDEGLAVFVESVLRETGLAGDCLELELTESTLMENVDQATVTLKRLQRLGINIAIDDFGTGYSSLSYLSRLSVHRIKLDRSFVRDLNTSADSAAIASAVVNLGHGLGLDVLAEGVENEAQLAHLKRLGCDAVQGYFYSPPLSAAAFEAFAAACLPFDLTMMSGDAAS